MNLKSTLKFMQIKQDIKEIGMLLMINKDII